MIVGTDRETKFYKNLLALEQISKEYEEEKYSTALEIEDELQALKATL